MKTLYKNYGNLHKEKIICWATCISIKKVKRSKGTKDLLCERFFTALNSLVPNPKIPQISLQKKTSSCVILLRQTQYIVSGGLSCTWNNLMNKW